MKYVEKILLSKEDADKSLAPARANEQAAKLGIAVATLDLDVKTQQNAVEALTNVYPLDIDAIVDAQDELDLSARRLSQLKDLQTSLFGS